MRAPQLLSAFPFCPRGVAGGASYFPWVSANPFPLKQLHGEWHRVATYEARVKIFNDPLTSSTGASLIQYAVPLARVGVATELDLCRPGFDHDVLHGPDVTGPFRWEGDLFVPLPGDDVFNSIDWQGRLNLCGCEDMNGEFWHPTPGPPGVYLRPTERYTVTPDELLWNPTMRLSLRGTYDDGSEGLLRIQSANPTDYLGAAPADILPIVATLDGVEFDAVAIDFSPAYAYGGAPELEIVRTIHYEYRTAAGLFPLYDVATGALLVGANPADGRL